ncbi:SAM-dependent methyltransferase [Actinophytocola sp.]|uniref:SAM-dependent methyltransferase n=1 Tax=Actinophytocola sp. TaxID=1872138 RepID=UPI002DDCE153|nr:SAM-dependent methyltransferase [Actinophytocola sp.]
MDRPSWAPEGVDVDMPSPARMYDALLGGSHNFAVDRRAVEMAVAKVPDLPKVAWSNRAFLRRSVRFMVAAGIRQFLDIGSGIPTSGNVHEVAWEADPQCRVQYVDLDSVAVAHSRAILAGQERAAAIEGDLRAPKELLADPRLRKMIDLSQPVGVLLVAVLHLLSDGENPRGVVAAIRDAIAPGSYIAISHLTSAQRPEDAMRLGEQAKAGSGVGIYFRSREDITALFDGLTVVAPGVVELALWRPESAEDIYEEPGRSLGLAGVGRRD